MTRLTLTMVAEDGTTTGPLWVLVEDGIEGVTLARLMDRWNEYRAAWVERFGDEDGFSEWFSGSDHPAACFIVG